jgi:two-component sensor histidine kinase
MPARIFNYGVPPQRLRTFLALFALALTTPLVGLAIYALTRMASFEQAETERQIIQVAESLAGDIDRELDRAVVVLETLTSSEPLKRRDWRAFHTQALAALRRTDAVIVVIDRNYQQVVDTLKDYGAELPKTADIATAQRVFETKQRQVSNLFHGSISGRPVFNVEVPVIDGEEVHYVLVMSFRASHMADVLRAARLPPPWITCVTDNNGIILARSERHDDFVGKPLPTPLLEQSRTASGVFTSTSAAGIPIARATVRSQAAGWLVSATVPVSYVQAPSLRIQGFALGMMATAIVLGLGLAYVFGGFMARPLTAAADVARKVGQGLVVAPLRTPLVEANLLTATLSTAASELRAATADLTQQKERSEFLMRELAHRSKNQLAVIRGMAQQTARQSDSVPDFVAHFAQRIQGLAQSQDLLLRQDWQGAWLSDLVMAHLDLFGIRSRTQVEGPPLFVGAHAVQNLGFALHELGTNATKHGALTVEHGQVHITWRVHEDQGTIEFEWRERNGSPVGPPTRRGFGQLVLTQLVAQALGGTSQLEFLADGLCWRLTFPASQTLKLEGKAKA